MVGLLIPYFSLATQEKNVRKPSSSNESIFSSITFDDTVVVESDGPMYRIIDKQNGVVCYGSRRAYNDSAEIVMGEVFQCVSIRNHSK